MNFESNQEFNLLSTNDAFEIANYKAKAMMASAQWLELRRYSS